MRIVDVLTADALGAFYFDDQAALRAGRAADGFHYLGEPLTSGFSSVRMPAAIVAIGLVLEDGSVAWGDCATVQYAGAGGREPRATRDQLRDQALNVVKPQLLGWDAAPFLDNCRSMSGLLPRALQYGLSQALLGAAAACHRITATEVLCESFRQPLPDAPVPLFAQSGDERHVNVDKMLMKQVAVLPHGLINTREKFGSDGKVFRDYALWVAERARRHCGGGGYQPVLHFDLYGMAGLEFNLDIAAIASFIAALEKDLRPFQLQIETPFDFGSRDAQLEGFIALRAALEERGAATRLVADEWCDTLADVHEYTRHRAAHMVQIKMPDIGAISDSAAAVLACRTAGLGAYLGGSCAETDLSARYSVHVALATRPDMLLAKPGMGVDEALTIVGNEQQRTLATIAAQQRRAASLP